jgi:hypothetical protein
MFSDEPGKFKAGGNYEVDIIVSSLLGLALSRAEKSR